MSGPPPATTLVLFARAPRAGQVKTRLVPALGEGGAAALYGALLDDTCALARGVAERTLLAVSGDLDDPLLGALARRDGLEITAQGEGDLGARMERALRQGLEAGARRVCILGSDAPHLPRGHLGAAFAHLAAVDLVLGPATDGGYWLIGARREAPELFSDVPWGGPEVLAITLRRLRDRGRSYALAPTFWDVDEPGDLRRLEEHLGARPGLAPATQGALSRLL